MTSRIEALRLVSSDKPANSKPAGKRTSGQPITIRIRMGTGTSWVRYMVAGIAIDSDVSIPCLEAFAQKGALSMVRPMSPVPLCELSSKRLTGWLGGSNRDLTVGFRDDGTTLNIQNAGSYLVTHGGDICAWGIESSGDALNPVVEEILVGPCLAIALAQRGVFLLHASAVTLDDKSVIAFAGDSGAGKSTLARVLEQRSNTATRVADDMLAVRMTDDGVVCLTQFPQLKLDAEQMDSISNLPATMNLDSIVLVDCDARGGNLIDRMASKDLASSLVKHGVGLQLLSSRTLARHFDFATRTPRSVSGFRLCYSHRDSVFWALEHALDEIGQVSSIAAS